MFSGNQWLQAVCACTFLICGCGQEPPAVVRQISVTGTGLAKADPDIATIVFGVDISSEDPAEAVSDAAALVNSAEAAVFEAGVAEDDISTQSYSLWIENVYDPITYQYTGERVFHVSHYETLEVRDLETVGDLLATLVESGINTISSVTFHVEDQTALYDQARQAALADAVRRAEAIAEGLGATLGEPVYVSEYGGGYTEFDQTTLVAGSTGLNRMENAPVFSPGSFSASASMTVTFEIE